VNYTRGDVTIITVILLISFMIY